MNTLPVPQDLLHAVAKIAGTSDIEAFSGVLARTIMPAPNVAPELITAFLMVAKEYDLNPVTKEIYAFPGKGGGIQPIVSIDGWLKIINSHPQYNGMEFSDSWGDDGNIRSITCRIYRKDREHATETTEYLAECKRNTDPWKQWPVRMLRHKATIQAARYAFGFSGIVDPDEAERIESVQPPKTVPATVPAEVLASGEQIAMIRELLGATGKDEVKMLAACGRDCIENMSDEQAQKVIRQLQKVLADKLDAQMPQDNDEIPV